MMAAGSEAGPTLVPRTCLNISGIPTSPPQAASLAPGVASTRQTAKARLMQVYMQHNPDKVALIEFLLDEFADREHVLLAKVYKKYNVLSVTGACHKSATVTLATQPHSSMASQEQPAVASSIDDQRTTFTVGQVIAQEHLHQTRATHGPQWPTEECSTADVPAHQPVGMDHTIHVLSAARDMVLSSPFVDDDELRRKLSVILAATDV